MWPWPVTRMTGNSASSLRISAQPVGAAQARQAHVADDDGRQRRRRSARVRVRRSRRIRLRSRPASAPARCSRRTSSSSSTSSTRMAAASLTVVTPWMLDCGWRPAGRRRSRRRLRHGCRRAACRRWRAPVVPRSTRPRPEPRAGRLAGDEGLEQARQDVGADARAGVGHAQDHAAVLRLAPRSADSARGDACMASMALRIRLTSTLPNAASLGHHAQGRRAARRPRRRCRASSASATSSAARRPWPRTAAPARRQLALVGEGLELRGQPRQAIDHACGCAAGCRAPRRGGSGRAGCRRCRTGCASPSSGWFSSCTMPADIWPERRHLAGMHQLALRRAQLRPCARRRWIRGCRAPPAARPGWPASAARPGGAATA